MKEITIGKNEAGQRLDKFLMKYLDTAPKGFVYKMLRKKNIKRNDKRAEGSEKLEIGDVVSIYISDDTLAGFRSGTSAEITKMSADNEKLLERFLAELKVLYEDEDVLIIDKPSGMLSQKASDSDVSAVEVITAYLLRTGHLSEAQLQSFRPSVCNRLDRNTSGILLCGKSLKGLQLLSEMLRERTAQKYYLAAVLGNTEEKGVLKGSLTKDENTNTVSINSDGNYIETRYRKIAGNGEISLLEVELITGKTHQIRAHLASIGHPVLGDVKYGDAERNRLVFRKYGAKMQLLHAWKTVFPDSVPEDEKLSGKTVICSPPRRFNDVLHALGVERR